MGTIGKIQISIIALALCISVGYARAPKKIINGETVRPGEITHQVSLQYTNYVHFCGGTILDSMHILTAAHCTIRLSSTGELFFVVVNALNDLDTPITPYTPSDIYYHDYREEKTTIRNDIAIIKLATPIMFYPFLKPAALPVEEIPDSGNAKAVGWGFTMYDVESCTGGNTPRYLQKLEKTIISHQECLTEVDNAIYPEHICTVSAEDTGMCFGDSGGALLINDTVIGIASWVYKGCALGYPDIYTRVYSYIDWIHKTLLL